MLKELYKIIYKKYYFSLILLLFMPMLFAIGYFLNLPYMVEENNLSTSALDYCAEMQMLIKYAYFLVIIYLSTDAFSGELEGGQLRLVTIHVISRTKIVLQKLSAICLFILVLHILFWLFNFSMYCLGNLKNNIPIVFSSKNIEIYIGIFGGYLVSFYVCSIISFFIGLFMKKIYTLVVVYFIWFVCRYADQIASMKNIFPEFMADYLTEISGNTTYQISGYLWSILFFFIILLILIRMFHNKNII
ncbi:MAG: hypothetical protein H2184_13140 [Candidatus Galacturonibacter soehngenii]|nr:hypothetical protein [Candidatus Galacturonibacter soehngenii]